MNLKWGEKAVGAGTGLATFGWCAHGTELLPRLASLFNGVSDHQSTLAALGATALTVAYAVFSCRMGYTAGKWISYGMAAERQQNLAKENTAIAPKPEPV